MAAFRVVSAYFALVLALTNDVMCPAFGFTNAPVSSSRVGRFALRSTSEASQQAIDVGASSNELDNDTGKPLWAKCINTVTSRTMPLNEAVSQAANVSLTEAVDLIEIGAVWAKMDDISEEDLLDQYYTTGSSAAAEDFSRSTEVVRSSMVTFPRVGVGRTMVSLDTSRRKKT